MLHCGACGEEFSESGKLTAHLDKSCPAGKMLLAYQDIMATGDNTGHGKSRLFLLTHKNSHVIDKYARMVSEDCNSMARAEVHYELCRALDLPYTEFKPFEADNIKKIPSFDECRRIIYDAIADIIIAGGK